MRRRAGEQLVVDGREAVERGAKSETLGDVEASGPTELPAPSGVVQQASQRSSDRTGVTRRHEEPGAVLDHHVGHAPHTGGHDR